MDLALAGKRALVLGASKGLGAAVARRLTAEGAQVAVVARSAPDYDGVHHIAADLAGAGAAGRIAQQALAVLGGVDILVLNSGGPAAGSARETGTGAFAAAFEPMFLAQTEIARTLLPGMAERGFGRIIAIGSISVAEPMANMVLSNSLRAALAAWCKTLSREVAAQGVTVNMLLPGQIATNRIRELNTALAVHAGISVEEQNARVLANIPAGRLGSPEEFGAAAAFLASPLAGYVTGSMLRIDGGLAHGF